jgi:hypothetical protein
LVRRPLFGLLYQPRMIDDDECGAVSAMRIGRGNRSTGRKPAPVPLCPLQLPHDLAAVGNRRLTAAYSFISLSLFSFCSSSFSCVSIPSSPNSSLLYFPPLIPRSQSSDEGQERINYALWEISEIYQLRDKYFRFRYNGNYFFSWGETESTWYFDHCMAYCTIPR